MPPCLQCSGSWVIFFLRLFPRSPARLSDTSRYVRKALSSPCVGVRVPPLSHFHIVHDIRGYWLMTSTYMIYYTTKLLGIQPLLQTNMIGSHLLTPVRSYSDTISWLLVVSMRIVIYSLGIVYEKMIVIVNPSQSVTKLAIALKICYHGGSSIVFAWVDVFGNPLRGVSERSLILLWCIYIQCVRVGRRNFSLEVALSRFIHILTSLNTLA